jgi:hypothetical protein
MLSRRVACARAPGGARVLTCTISTPFATGPKQAGCEVVIGEEPPRTIYGIDAMQAVQLSIAYIDAQIGAIAGAEWALANE